MEGTIERSIGCLRANGLAARPRDEGAHFTGSGGTSRKKWLKREEMREWHRPMHAQRRAGRRARRITRRGRGMMTSD
ncbi:MULTISPECIES: hypothetical protein [Burkholderia]|uniref:hypothetical protein n=1 Tax=Burkholderia TaxID=32008 RepID=UPI0013CE76A2|nr:MULTISPECIES: hypothetical protein [Burkholderia]ELK6464432.1 hypothetical protein [Burkholderia contaminans]MCA7882939.1 hypothetical protein [Burkholderia contaminans]HEM7876889.1 hypothetical protein [Burkholderia contaminans]